MEGSVKEEVLLDIFDYCRAIGMPCPLLSGAALRQKWRENNCFLVYPLKASVRIISPSFSNWCSSHDFDQSKKNVDILFEIINMIYDFINTNSVIADVAGKLANKLVNASCCKKKENPEKVASQNLEINKSQLELITKMHSQTK